MPASDELQRSAGGLSAPLVDELVRQNQALSHSTARARYLDALRTDGVRVAVTGQQVGLFLGPAYSFYKAATTVAWARREEARTRRPVVPMFWLQSEDHDGGEVATAQVQDADGTCVEIHLEPTGDPRASMAARQLGEGVNTALRALDAALDGAAQRSELMELLRRHYTADASWVDAFAGVLGEVFAEEGLLVLDPRTPAMATLSQPVHEIALTDAENIDAALAEGVALAGEAMVNPRPGTSLSFFHPYGPQGARYRLQRAGGGWQVDGAVASTEEVLQRVALDPLIVSTSSLLRVMLQDLLLPVAAQIAGPGESRYLRQLPPMAHLFGVQLPPVIPRARLAVTTKTCRRRLQALSLTVDRVVTRDALLAQLCATDAGPTGNDILARIVGAVEHELSALAVPLATIDPTMERALARTRRHVKKGAQSLGRRVDRARAIADEVRVERVEHLCDALMPKGIPQERALAFPHFGARWGVANFKRAVFEAIETHLDTLGSGAEPGLLELAL